MRKTIERLEPRRFLSGEPLDLLAAALPRPASSNPQVLADNDTHVLVAATNANNEIELWTNDGTAEGLENLGTVEQIPRPRSSDGTNIVFNTPKGPFAVDILSGPLNKQYSDSAEYNGIRVSEFDRKLVLADLETGARTTIALDTGGRSRPDLVDFTTTPSGVFFTVYYDFYETEIWWTDGKEESTKLIRTSRESDDYLTRPSELVWFEGQLYYADNFELRRFDPKTNQTSTLKSFAETATEQPAHFLVHQEEMFFAADGGQGVELWVTDGTPIGTRQVLDLNPNSYDSKPNYLVELGGSIIFSATNPEVGRELWSLEIASGEMRLLADLQQGFLPPPRTTRSGGIWYEHNGLAYFSMDAPPHGGELWRTDGTPDGTFLVRDIAETNDNTSNRHSIPEHLFGHGEWVYFFASDRGKFSGIRGFELWRTNGVDETELIKDINLGRDSSLPSNGPNYTVWNNEIYFIAYDGIHGEELWKTDGTTSGTQLVRDFHSKAGRSTISAMHGTEEGLVFFDEAWDGYAGSVLVRWNGIDEEVLYSGEQLEGLPDINQITEIDGELILGDYRLNPETNKYEQWLRGWSNQQVWIDDSVDSNRTMQIRTKGLFVTDQTGSEKLIDPIAAKYSPLLIIGDKAYYYGDDDHSIRSYSWDDSSPTVHLKDYRRPTIYASENHALAMVRKRSSGPYEVWLLGTDPKATKLITLQNRPEVVSELDGNVLIFVRQPNTNLLQLLSIPVPSLDDARTAQIDELFAVVRANSNDANYDFNNDDSVDQGDVDYLFQEKRKTTLADLDLNGTVDFSDFLKLSTFFGQTEALWSQGDLNGDGVVAFADFLILSNLFGLQLLSE